MEKLEEKIISISYSGYGIEHFLNTNRMVENHVLTISMNCSFQIEDEHGDHFHRLPDGKPAAVSGVTYVMYGYPLQTIEREVDYNQVYELMVQTRYSHVPNHYDLLADIIEGFVGCETVKEKVD